MDNHSRAEAAGAAIEAHCDATNSYENDSIEDLTDLLTNLRHYAKQHGLSFATALRLSRQHFDAEK